MGTKKTIFYSVLVRINMGQYNSPAQKSPCMSIYSQNYIVGPQKVKRKASNNIMH